MLNIKSDFKDGSLTVSLDGEINTGSADKFNNAVENLDDVSKLILDFTNVEYISSAGLRVLVKTQNIMDEKAGTMIIIGVNESVNEVFEMTALTEILRIETI